MGRLTPRPDEPVTHALPAAEWVRLFATAGIAKDAMAAAQTPRAKQTVVGKILYKMVGREILTEIDDQLVRAKIVAHDGPKKKRLYGIQVRRVGDDPASTGKASQATSPTATEPPASTAPPAEPQPTARRPRTESNTPVKATSQNTNQTRAELPHGNTAPNPAGGNGENWE